MNKQQILAQMMREVDEQTSNFQPETALPMEAMLHADAMASACAVPQGVSKPYIFTITNSSGSLANAYLFGSNIYLFETNYGSDAGITITPANRIGYSQFLMATAQHSFEFVAGRISCSEATQLDQSMMIGYKDINGRKFEDPIPMSSFRNSFQNQNDMVDFFYPTKIDGDSYLILPIVGGEGTTTVVVTLYPSKIYDGAMTFNGRPAVKVYDLPQLSGVVNIQRPVAANLNQWPQPVGQIIAGAQAMPGPSLSRG